MNWSPKIAASIAAVLFLLSSVTAVAFDDDEMTFEPDEVQQDEDDGDMTFAPDDYDDDDFDPGDDIADGIDVGVVAVPGDDLTDARRNELQTALRDAADRVPDINTYGDSDLLPGLIDRDPDYCSREALCLAGIGRDAAVDRILQARVEQQDGDFRIDIDYFDVSDRIFVAYHSNSGLSSFGDVLEAVGPGVDDIFGIRRGDDDDPFVDEREVDVQRIMAFGTGGAAAVSLIGGVIFGLQANGYKNDLENAQNSDGDYTGVTQIEAQEMRRSWESAALNANIFYVFSALAGTASVLLFVLGGDDPPADDETASALDIGGDSAGVELRPRFDAESAGIDALIRF